LERFAQFFEWSIFEVSTEHSGYPSHACTDAQCVCCSRYDRFPCDTLGLDVHRSAGVFPGRGNVIWRDWYTHDIVDMVPGDSTTLTAPLGHINVHGVCKLFLLCITLTGISVRDGAAILLHAQPAYTTEETRNGPYSLLVSLTKDGDAFGTAYIDDGESYPLGPSKALIITVRTGSLQIQGQGDFYVRQKLENITVLGVGLKPNSVVIQGKGTFAGWQYFDGQQKLVLSRVDADLNVAVKVAWY
jgi:alpha-glucosidase